MFSHKLGYLIGRSNLHRFYHTITIGTPPKEYYVQVDTRSDILWIDCHMKGYHDERFAKTSMGLVARLIRLVIVRDESYGDGSNSMGYLVKDLVQYHSVSGDFETRLENASVIFGCRTIQSGNLNSSFDGILGFGKSNASVLSQLASLGVKRMFAHCLDSYNMGGNITAYVTRIEVGGEFLNLSNGGVDKRKAVIDSGTSLVYLPEVIYKPLVNKILAVHSDIYVLHDTVTCIGRRGIKLVDDEFPAVTFHFENSLSLKVDPHDYLFKYVSILCLANPLELFFLQRLLRIMVLFCKL
ncbi:putative cathepsin D [Helianthus annuus]|uniref:Cathepsin D n=1 Tax=Helianthus annuus TaxID=4232 RepID=A0A251VR18_HELAN|nr:putative cathepsin D [Helianthus annuus]KAJ0957251.1 putative cathepsin D [Helianthus annuus]